MTTIAHTRIQVPLPDAQLRALDDVLHERHVAEPSPTATRPGSCIEQAYYDAVVLMGNEGALLEAEVRTVWALASWLRTVVLASRGPLEDHVSVATATLEAAVAETGFDGAWPEQFEPGE